jgi:hypothetical protein
MFFTMTGGKDASDKYHKQGEKSPEPDKGVATGPEKSKKTGFPGRCARGSRFVVQIKCAVRTLRFA